MGQARAGGWVRLVLHGPVEGWHLQARRAATDGGNRQFHTLGLNIPPYGFEIDDFIPTATTTVAVARGVEGTRTRARAHPAGDHGAEDGRHTRVQEQRRLLHAKSGTPHTIQQSGSVQWAWGRCLVRKLCYFR